MRSAWALASSRTSRACAIAASCGFGRSSDRRRAPGLRRGRSPPGWREKPGRKRLAGSRRRLASVSRRWRSTKRAALLVGAARRSSRLRIGLVGRGAASGDVREGDRQRQGARGAITEPALAVDGHRRLAEARARTDREHDSASPPSDEDRAAMRRRELEREEARHRPERQLRDAAGRDHDPGPPNDAPEPRRRPCGPSRRRMATRSGWSVAGERRRAGPPGRTARRCAAGRRAEEPRHEMARSFGRRCGADVCGLGRSSWALLLRMQAAHGTRQAGTPAARWADELDRRRVRTTARNRKLMTVFGQNRSRNELERPRRRQRSRRRRRATPPLPTNGTPLRSLASNRTPPIHVPELTPGIGCGSVGSTPGGRSLVLRRVHDRGDDAARAAEPAVLRAAGDVRLGHEGVQVQDRLRRLLSEPVRRRPPPVPLRKSNEVLRADDEGERHDERQARSTRRSGGSAPRRRCRPTRGR